MTPLASTGLSKQQAYQEAAWLFSKLSGTPSQDLAVAINYAIWGLFSQDALNSSAYASSGAAAWKNLANTGITDATFLSSLGNYVVYTPIDRTQTNGWGLPQEYIGVSVPEPASLLMLSSGILGVFGLKRRKK
jgi:hypothetical protein